MIGPVHDDEATRVCIAWEKDAAMYEKLLMEADDRKWVYLAAGVFIGVILSALVVIGIG